MCNELIYPEYIIYGAIYGALRDSVLIQLLRALKWHDQYTWTVRRARSLQFNRLLQLIVNDHVRLSLLLLNSYQ